MTAPERSLAQRRAALDNANRVRVFRAQMKKAIKAGELPVADVIVNPPAEAQTMRVYDLLLAAPKYGRVKTTKTLRLCVISPSKTVGGLSVRQRREIAGRLR